MSDDSSEPLGFNLDIGKILKDVTDPPKRRRRTTRGTSSSSDADAAIRRAVRAELDDVKRAIRDLAEEVVRLRRANEALADKVTRLTKTK
ncbi:MAG TPA: hypothetical protein VFL03_09460 [Candidatus Limnocylindrales bacterium]|nr:hypothetical protein [Candidatus Limnocylindrales bacterium]